MLDALLEFGLPVSVERAIAQGAEGLIAFHRAIAERRAALPFDIDGVVYKVNRLDWQRELGFRTREPRWASGAQIPGTRRIDGSRNHRGASRAHGGRDTGCAAQAGVRGRSQPSPTPRCTTPTKWPRKDVRVGDTVRVRRGRRRDSRSNRRGAGATPRRGAAFHHPDPLPGLWLNRWFARTVKRSPAAWGGLHCRAQAQRGHPAFCLAAGARYRRAGR
jgi:hypothetical protein